VAGDGEAVEAQRRHSLDLVEGEGPLRIAHVVGSGGGLGAVAVAAQIGDDDGERGGQARGELAPHQMGLRVAVQQQERRSAAAGHQVDLGARGRDPAAREAGKEVGHA